ncbi:MAG: metallophosphoesterase family protein [Alphaproteobacteria bacterium]|nr:metallophosphoesterase family protein [Alphaproteobacteria bacterium]MCB9794563.1 metallophosphoesterase family protein [Alphaproteobacteria bacterium]
MRLAVLSDLHIGASARADAFGHDEDEFLRWLDALEREHDGVLLLGDVYQCDHGLRPGHRAAGRLLERARARSPRLSARFEAPHYRWVHGNHDLITRDALGAPERLRLGQALFLHGHQFDPLIQRQRRVSAAATWASGRLRAAGLSPLAQSLEDQDVAIKARRYQTPEGPYARGAEALMAETGASLVVMGHTHVRVVLELAGGRLANTGTCSRGRREGLSVDTETGALRFLA